MASSSAIKGLTVEIGANTTEFSTALKNIERDARNISKDLKTVNENLKLDPSSAEKTADKLKILQDAAKTAADKVNLIKQAIQKLNEQEADKSTERYKNALAELERELESATREQELANAKVEAFEGATDAAGGGALNLADLIKGNLISSAITGGISIVVDLLKQAAQFAIEAAKGVANFIGETIDLAKNMEETRSKVAAVFGEEGQAQIEEWASNAAHDFHTTQQSAMEAVSAFGNIMLNMGMASNEALKYSEQLVLVAAAQADFNNMETPEVLDKITSALAGNYKGLQSLGIVLKEADIQERALLDTGKAEADQLTDLEKKQAALEIIIEKSSFAVQKYNENTGSLVSMQAELKAKFEDVKTEIGERLYPVAEKIFNKIIEFTNSEQFTELLNTIYSSVDEIANAVLEFVNDGRLEEWINWLKDNLPQLGEKISEVAGKFADIVGSIWNAIDAFKAWKEETKENIVSGLENSGLFKNLPTRSNSNGATWTPRAVGGYAYANRPYLVGDDAQYRPEIYIPNTDGRFLNGDQTERILNNISNNNSRNFSGGINIYVNSYGMNVAEVADELGAAFNNRIRMSGATL